MVRIAENGQQGSARLKFVIIIAIIGVLTYVGYQIIPVAYQAFVFKDLMQHYVDVASTQGYPPAWVTDQLTKSLAENDIPPNAVITPAQRDNRMEVRVQFVRPVEFPGYTYEYNFDYTAKSTAFLTFK